MDDIEQAALQQLEAAHCPSSLFHVAENKLMVRACIGASVVAATVALTPSPSYGVADGCAIVLRTPDGFLSVRNGPSPSQREVHKLLPGQIVTTHHVSDSIYAGRWWRINGYMNKPGEKPHPLLGWIHSKYVRGIECEE